MDATSAKETRRYDSPVRREQAAETRERILEAGAALVHELLSWDWRSVTVRAVAARAGVHERTVHRHFATEQDLHAAVLQRLIEESGVIVEGMSLDEVPRHVDQLFHYLASFTSSTEREPDAAQVILDERRKTAIVTTVTEAAGDLPVQDIRLIAAMVDVLWGQPTYRRLINGWGFGADDATRGVNWLIGLLSDAVRAGRGPGSTDADR
jgi:AcrR family transcriptional regulator